AAARGGAGSHSHFLSVIFPHHEMTILDYNRVLHDLNGRSPEQLLAELRQTAAREFGMHVAGRWYRLTLAPDLAPANDPIGRLPITLLSRQVIEPLFG